MKTLKTLLKELLSKSNSPESNQEPENKSNSLTQNQNQNETETDETARNPVVDCPFAGEGDRTDPKCPENKAGEPGEPGGDSGVTTEDPQHTSDASHQEAIKEAYRQGEIAGRNAQIEEKYFPKTDDGIPHFRGRPSRHISSADIFSMAREA